MSKTQKSVLPQNLDRYSVFIEDREPLSAYFRLSDFPDVLTGGKNAFLITGTKELNPATEVKVEIKDSLGNTIFVAPIKNYQEGLARLISIEVYEDTPPGEATVTIMGEARVTIDGRPIPEAWKGRYNVKWQKKINVQPSAVNNTKIRLYDTPVINVSEISVPYLNPYTSSIVNISGNATLQAVKTPYLENNTNISSYYINNAAFPYVRDMEGGTITIPAYNLTSSVVRVFNSSSLQIASGTFAGSVSTAVSLSYQPSPQFTSTSLTKSLADIRITKLTTFAGDIARAKVYVRSLEDGGTYQLIEDRRLEAVGVMLTASAAGLQDVAIGTFNNATVLSNYWRVGTADISTGYTVSPSVTMSYSSARIVDGVYNSSDLTLSSTAYTSPRFFFGVQTPLNFNQELEYTLTETLACYKTNPNFNAVCEVYLSGSAFPTTNKLGHLVQTFTVEQGKEYTRFDKSALNFYASLSGQASLNFVVYGGEWHFADISVDSATETGFNPDEARVISTITGRRFERLMFKVELLDNNSNIVPINIESSPYYFDGGNLYIKGGDNRLIGQISVLTEGDAGRGVIISAHPSASTLGTSGDTNTGVFPYSPKTMLTYTGSGLVTMYSGSNPFGGGQVPPTASIGLQILGGGVSGSILDWNSYNGVLKIRGDIELLPGTPLSTSISYLTSGAAGNIDATARAQIDQIVSGTFPNGTYISYNHIFSPTITGLVIGGVQGYISQSFRVGNVSNGNGIILTAMGFNSGGVFYPNAPAIFIGGDTNGSGSFNNANTPFFVASSSLGPIFSLGNIFSVQGTGINTSLNLSGTLAVYTGSQWVDVRNVVTSSVNIYSSSQATYNYITQQANSASTAQLSASFLNFTSSVFWPYSASQATINYEATSSLIALSASNAQLSASVSNLSSGSGFWADSASNAALWASQSANNTAQSASIAQASASFLNFTSSVFWPYSASQAVITYNTYLSASAYSSSAAQQIEFRAVTDAANRIKLPTSEKTGSYGLTGGLFLEQTAMGFWQPAKATIDGLLLSGNLQQNYPVIINSTGQFRFGHSQSWDFTNSEFSESIAFANEALKIKTSRLLVSTPGLTLASTRSSAVGDQALNYIKMGGAGASANLTSDTSDNLSGSYLDGTGAFRFGYAGSHIKFNPTVGALFMSTSYFNLQAGNTANGQITLNPYYVSIGKNLSGNIPTSGWSAGFIVSNTGELWLGSGSITSTQALSGIGSYLHFNPTMGVIQLKTNALFISTSNASILSSGSGGVTNVIKFWSGSISASGLTLNAQGDLATGSYIDGDGNFRFGYRNQMLQGGPSYGMIMSTSYLNMQAGNPTSLAINPFYIALGNPIPTVIPADGNSKVGFIVTNTGDLWLGSGSIDSTNIFGARSTGSYLQFVSNLNNSNQGVLSLRTTALFITSSNMMLMASGTGGVTNVIKVWSGSTAQPTSDAQSDVATGSYIDGDGNFRFGYKNNTVQFAPAAGFSLSSSYFNLCGGSPTTVQINPFFIAVGSLATLGAIPTSSYSSGAILSNTGEFWVGSGSINSTQALSGTGSYLHFNPSLGGRGVLQLKTDALFISSSNTFIMASGSGGFTNVIRLSSGTNSASMAPWTDLATGSYMDGFGNFRLGHSGSYIVFNPNLTGSLLIQSDKLLINSSKFSINTLLTTASLGLGAAAQSISGSGIYMDGMGYFRAGQNPYIGGTKFIQYDPILGSFDVYNLRATNLRAASGSFTNLVIDNTNMGFTSNLEANTITAKTITILSSSVLSRTTRSIDTRIDITQTAGFVAASGSSTSSIFEIGTYYVPQAGAVTTPGSLTFTPETNSNTYSGNTGLGFNVTIKTDTQMFTVLTGGTSTLMNNIIDGNSNWSMNEYNNPIPGWWLTVNAYVSCSVNGGPWYLTSASYNREEIIDAGGTYGRPFSFTFTPPANGSGSSGILKEGDTVRMIVFTNFQGSGVA